MADTRIDKLAAICTGTDGTHLTEPISAEDEAEHLLDDIEVAGLVVIDPEGPALHERIQAAIESANDGWSIEVDDVKGLTDVILNAIRGGDRG